MAIPMVCPNVRCKHVHQFPDEARGQVIRCLKCSQQFRIPSPRLPAPKGAKARIAGEFLVPAGAFVF